MLNIDATDKIEGIASVADKIEFTCSVVDGTTVKSSEGLLSNSQTQIYLAVAATRILSLTLVNTHTSAVTVNIQKDPTDAGTLYRIIPKDLSLGIGHMLISDGQRCTVMDTNGNIITSLTADDSAYGIGWNGSKLSPTQDRVYDEMETKADKGANSDITSMSALTQLIHALSIESDSNQLRLTASDEARMRLYNTNAGNGRNWVLGTNTVAWSDLTFKQSNAAQGDPVAAGTVRMVMNATGVGLGTSIPGNPLAVNRSADGIIVDFESADVVEGNVSIAGNTTSYNAFVGSHYTQLKQGQKELPIGAVVISTGEIIPCEVTIKKETKEEAEILIENAFEDVEVEIDLIIETEVNDKVIKSKKVIGEEFREYRVVDGKVKKIMKPIYEKTIIQKTQLKASHALNSKTGKIIKTITAKQNISPDVNGKEYFPYIDTTTKPADKRVYGVWFGKLSDDAKGMSFGQDNKPVYLIAQVGLFKVRATDLNGNIGIGDYLESSSRSMEAQKQTSKQKESGTIAKAMVNTDWSKVTIDSELGYKWKLIPCIF